MPQGYEVCMRRPGEPFMPVRQYLELHLSHRAVKDFCAQIGNNIEQENSGYSAPFGQMCQALMDELFSEIADPRIKGLREAIRALDSPLLIVTNDHTVCWELLRDGPGECDYLGIRIDMGRSLRTKSVPRSMLRSDRRLRCLFIADPNPDEAEWELPEAAAEVRTLSHWLEAKQFDCTDLLLGADASVGAVFDRLATSAYDLIHYAGHVVLDPESREYALRLYDGRLFPASSIRKQVRGSPMVFLTACRSSSTQGAAMNAAGSVESLTHAFLEAGAQFVVGSLFKVPEAGSRQFAEKFYEGVLARQSVGASIRLARAHVRGRPGCGATWASFVLYGDPCLVVDVRRDSLELPGNEVETRDSDQSAMFSSEPAPLQQDPLSAESPAPVLEPVPSRVRPPPQPAQPPVPARLRSFDSFQNLDSRQVTPAVAVALRDAVLDARALGLDGAGPQALAIACLSSDAVMQSTRQTAQLRATTAPQRRQALYESMALAPSIPATAGSTRDVRLEDFTAQAQEVLRAAEAYSTTTLDWPALLGALRESPEVMDSPPLLVKVEAALVARAKALANLQEDRR